MTMDHLLPSPTGYLPREVPILLREIRGVTSDNRALSTTLQIVTVQ